MKPAITDPLTDILGSAATKLTCTTPDALTDAKSPELNPGKRISGQEGTSMNACMQSFRFVKRLWAHPSPFKGFLMVLTF